MELREIRHEKQPGVLAEATLACPECDAPVLPPGGRAPVTAQATCPYCGHEGVLRDFLSLEVPTRPTHVLVRVRQPSLRAPT